MTATYAEARSRPYQLKTAALLHDTRHWAELLCPCTLTHAHAHSVMSIIFVLIVDCRARNETGQIPDHRAVWQLQPEVVQTVQQHVSYEYIWIRRTIVGWIFTIACSLVVGSGLGLGSHLVSGCKLLCTRIWATVGCNCHTVRSQPQHQTANRQRSNRGAAWRHWQSVWKGQQVGGVVSSQRVQLSTVHTALWSPRQHVSK